MEKKRDDNQVSGVQNVIDVLHLPRVVSTFARKTVRVERRER